ncbi:hypothetical protein LSH36_406g01054 [Paralvinella palmiformis]|uniref:Uncharacterized protein n=1 Tax=Paralvinella palmiformis TaxID=53620 RepID=A0AAD9JCX7_9ANNE|nr:hypothetical protein LSH36_406g01054 [Paralvinella palmiformis]
MFTRRHDNGIEQWRNFRSTLYGWELAGRLCVESDSIQVWTYLLVDLFVDLFRPYSGYLVLDAIPELAIPMIVPCDRIREVTGFDEFLGAFRRVLITEVQLA